MIERQLASLHHASPGAPRRRSGSIPALHRRGCCWLLGQVDGPVLHGLDRDLLGGRQPRTRRVVSSSPHFDALLAAPLWIAPVQFRYSTTAASACYLHRQTHRSRSVSIATVLMSGEQGEGELRARACILTHFRQHGVAGLCGDPGLGQQAGSWRAQRGPKYFPWPVASLPSCVHSHPPSQSIPSRS